MHFFELAGPDFILGFDADPAIRNVVGVILAAPELAVKAVKLRAFGQEIIRTLGDKRIHPRFGVPGGVSSTLSVEQRDAILQDIDVHIATTQTGIAVFKDWAEKRQAAGAIRALRLSGLHQRAGGGLVLPQVPLLQEAGLARWHLSRWAAGAA
jgi:coenzyme F420-reducing hydrogenase alpha subunit